MLKVEEQHFYDIFWPIRTQLMFKNFLWVMWKISGLFVNPFTADNKYSPPRKGNLRQHFRIQLSQKKKMYSNIIIIIFAFSKFRFDFEHFEKETTLIADVFSNLRTRKNVVR